MSDSDTTFLSRWSRRKAAVREGKAVPDEAQAPATSSPLTPPAPAAPPPQEPEADSAPLPTLADVAQLSPGDNIARFVTPGVDESVKRAALKTLFADPHFNVMDGLDIYIDDYSKPDPIPLDVLRRLTQSETLGLFDPIEDDAQQAQELQQVQAPQADADSAPAAEAAAKSAEDSAEDSAAGSAAESADDVAADKHA
ncbi:MAG: DUF3306 domain-containing protein [Cupriavidus sp.]|nr:DUF3306 domain-containing protein [Cupriavidus sp.]